jgi:hypothetical protein
VSKAVAAFASVIFLVALSGCATAPTQSDLLQAEAAAGCPKTAPKGTAVSAANCYIAADRQVWATQSPDTLNLFDEWAARKLSVAEQFDYGKINQAEFVVADRNAFAVLQAGVRQRQASNQAEASE